MHVLLIKSFLHNLTNCRDALPIDRELSARLTEYFDSKNPNDVLNDADFSFLIKQFVTRWNKIKSGPNCYTQKTKGSNALWIQLAKDLASIPAVNKNYVQILFPDVVNTMDPNDEKQLSDTRDPDNFFLSADGFFLYRKLSFLERLRVRNYHLSTCHYGIPKDNCFILKVKELASLQNAPAKEITINSKSYRSFWDILVKEAFPKLNVKNELPLPLIAQLLSLMKRYHCLRNSARPFSEFQSELDAYFNFLYGHNLEEINSLYGVHFTYAGNTIYLLNLLIDLHHADCYENLEVILNIFASKLYELNPALNINDQFIPQVSPGEAHTPMHLNNAKKMLVSLFTYSFNSLIDQIGLSHSALILCDINCSVPSQAVDLFDEFKLLMSTEDNEAAVACRYSQLVKPTYSVTNQGIFSKGYLGSFLSFSYNQWVKQLKENTLKVYYYDPEIILQGLLYFHPLKSTTKPEMRNFLNQLIRTYSQDPPLSTFEKGMRINILFNNMLSHLETQNLHADRDAILLMMELSSSEPCKAKFIENCTYWIGSELQRMASSCESKVHSGFFFSGISEVDQFKNNIASRSLTTVSAVIKYYFDELNPAEGLNVAMKRKLIGYVQELEGHIITCQESALIKQSVEYFVNPTDSANYT